MVGEHSEWGEVGPRGPVDRLEETLPAQVARKQMRALLAENLRIPEQGYSAQGESVPKARPKGVADGNPVNIPEPPKARYHEGGTQEARRTGYRLSRVRLVGGRDRQIRSSVNAEGLWRSRKRIKSSMPCCRENPLRRAEVTVPQTDTGR